MAIFPLIQATNPLLSLKLRDVSKDCDRPQLTLDLIETMQANNGIGLSANQCSVMERVFVMYSDIKENKIMACFDPQITEMSSEKIIMDEGCLTFPALWLKVYRPVWIKATWEDQHGVKDEYQLHGLESRIFQHEYDHMEGTDFTKQVSKLKLDMAKKRLAKVKKKIDISKSA
jgi:peptide deformylase